jgi:hypothetical protein
VSSVRCLCARVPCISGPARDIQSFAAAPMFFRRHIGGVLVIGGRPSGYDDNDVTMLEQVGRAALAHYESLRCGEEAGIPCPCDVSRLAHDLRQPLGAIEALTYCIRVVVPECDRKIRTQLGKIQSQVDIASRLLTKAVQPERRAHVEPIAPSLRRAVH